MHLTEELLTEWTGLRGRDLSLFYLTYKKHSANALLHTDLEYIKQDILKFKDTVYKNKTKNYVTCGTPLIYAKIKKHEEEKPKQTSNVKSMIQLWESKMKRDM